MSPDLMGLTPLASALGLFMVAAMGVGPSPATAQNGSVTGKVSDARGAGLGGVEVAVIGGTVKATTSDAGFFKLSMPAGTHRLSVRRVGFAQILDSVTVFDDAVLDRQFVLTPTVVSLDPVTVARPLSVNMRRFEERRKSQQGSFLVWADLKKDETKQLRSVLARRLPGISFVSYRGALYAASVRGNTPRWIAGLGSERLLRTRGVPPHASFRFIWTAHVCMRRTD